MKICTKCNKELDESCFSKKGDGLSPICKECKREYDKQYALRRKNGEIKTEDINIIIGTDYKIRICEKCGKEFKVGRKPSKHNDFLIRKYCPECSYANQQYKEKICKNCGKTFLVGRAPDGIHFKNTKLCEECSKPATTKIKYCEKCGKPFTVDKYPGTDSFRKIRFCSPECAQVVPFKTSICECCGKEFELQRKDGHFIPRQYCSRECRLTIQRQKLKEKQEETLAKVIKTCRERYGVDYPCLSPNCVNANPMIISKINERFAELLVENDIDFEFEFPLGVYHFDFYLPEYNLLVEINPTFTHTCFDTGVYDPRPKTYHYDKTKYAIDNGYLCLCVWDWDNWNDIINLIKNGFKLEYKGITMHWLRNNEHIIMEDDIIYQSMLTEGYLPIYDNGYKVIPL